MLHLLLMKMMPQDKIKMKIMKLQGTKKLKSKR